MVLYLLAVLVEEWAITNWAIANKKFRLKGGLQSMLRIFDEQTGIQTGLIQSNRYHCFEKGNTE
jgi:hypothetical protein